MLCVRNLRALLDLLQAKQDAFDQLNTLYVEQEQRLSRTDALIRRFVYMYTLCMHVVNM